MKHLTCAHDDEKLTRLVHECGLEGYGFYWLLCEVVAASIGKTDKSSITHPVAFWRSKLGTNRHKLLRMLQLCSNIALTSHKLSGEMLEVSIPNILKYRDEWSSRSGVTRELLGSKESDTEAEADTKTDIKPSCALTRTVEDAEPALTLVPPETKEEKAARRTKFLDESHSEFYAGYWRKVGRPYSRKAWAGAIVKVGKAQNCSSVDAAQFLMAQMLAQRRQIESRADLDWLEKTHPASWLNGEGWANEISPPRFDHPSAKQPLIRKSAIQEAFDRAR